MSRLIIALPLRFATRGGLIRLPSCLNGQKQNTAYCLRQTFRLFHSPRLSAFRSLVSAHSSLRSSLASLSPLHGRRKPSGRSTALHKKHSGKKPLLAHHKDEQIHKRTSACQQTLASARPIPAAWTCHQPEQAQTAPPPSRTQPPTPRLLLGPARSSPRRSASSKVC